MSPNWKEEGFVGGLGVSQEGRMIFAGGLAFYLVEDWGVEGLKRGWVCEGFEEMMECEGLGDRG